MALLRSSEWKVAEAIAGIGYANPFLPARIELEKKALGRAFIPSQSVVQFRPEHAVGDMFPNARNLRLRSEQLLEKMRNKLMACESASPRELEVYASLALFQLYARYMSTVLDLPVGSFRHRPEDDIRESYDAFAKDYHYYLELPDREMPAGMDRDIMFAGLYQIERAFFHIFRHIVGASSAAAQLRAAIWQSIFTHDMKRYLRSMYRHMGDVTTLITGPSGTGKDLVAQSIGYSRFVEFDPKRRAFVANYVDTFYGLNLTAIAPSLIESELFGHAKGAFTDAKAERKGFLDESLCTQWGTIFLDEIGELDSLIQVKLLRVLQNREFQRVGESQLRRFVGKIVAATNRNLAVEIRDGRFREDFYYRLCADRIETPTLHEQLRESPDDLSIFVRFIATRLLPEIPEEVETLSNEVVTWVHENLGEDYAWPGNIRELEQCVRSILIRGNYTPTLQRTASPTSETSRFVTDIENGLLNREQLLNRYASLLYSRSGSYRATGKRLGVDWRTVKQLVDLKLVGEFGDESA